MCDNWGEKTRAATARPWREKTGTTSTRRLRVDLSPHPHRGTGYDRAPRNLRASQHVQHDRTAARRGATRAWGRGAHSIARTRGIGRGGLARSARVHSMKSRGGYPGEHQAAHGIAPSLLEKDRYAMYEMPRVSCGRLRMRAVCGVFAATVGRSRILYAPDAQDVKREIIYGSCPSCAMSPTSSRVTVTFVAPQVRQCQYLDVRRATRRPCWSCSSPVVSTWSTIHAWSHKYLSYMRSPPGFWP